MQLGVSYEEYDEEEDDPFEKNSGRDIFYEQRMLQQKIDERPERVTFQQEVERSSYQASLAESSIPETNSEALSDRAAVEGGVPKFRHLREDQLVQLDDYEPNSDELEEPDSANFDTKKLKDMKKRRQSKMRKMSKKMKKNTVSFKYNVKLARIPKKKEAGWSQWITGMFGSSKGTSIKDLAKVEHVPEQESCPRQEYHTTVQAGQTAFIQFKVFNYTDNDWDPGCFLINDYDGGRQENFFEISKSVTNNHMFYLEIQIYIPAIVHE